MEYLPYIAAVLIVLAALAAEYLAARYFMDRIVAVHREELADGLTESAAATPPWSLYAKKIAENSAWLRAQSWERVSITSRDGLRLAGYRLPAKDARRRVLFFHGYKSNPWLDNSGMGRYLHEHGCELFMADQRGHGESEGEYITFGVRERLDCADWVSFLNGRCGEELPVYLLGISMGAATVLMAAGEALPGNVRGVLADCGFTSPKAEFEHILKSRMKLWPPLMLPAAGLLCRARAGFGFSECSTLTALAKTKLPVLLVHGGRDNFVPTRMSRENYAACRGEKRLMIVEGAPHALSYYFEPENYTAAVMGFFAEHDG